MLLDGKLQITPNEWLIPLRDNPKRSVVQFEQVGTMFQQMKNDLVDALGIKWYTTDSKVYTSLKQEGRRWREILDPIYREHKLQIRGVVSIFPA